jgi:N-acetylglucosamine-6-phosphate deacetylase
MKSTLKTKETARNLQIYSNKFHWSVLTNQMSCVIFAKRLVTPKTVLHDVYLEVEGGIIINITDTTPNQTSEKCDILIPGFVDLHNHGIGGSDNVLDYWLSDYTTRNLPKFGTTSVLASLTFPDDEDEKTRKVIAHLEDLIGKVFENQTVIAGIHAEGPIIATTSGLPASKSQLSLNEFDELVDSMPSLRIMTISPSLECKCDYERIKSLVKRGVTPALGHDANATELEILGAIKSVTEKKLHITHLFNVCLFHHRNVSLVNFALMNKIPKFYGELIAPSVEVIGDFIHVNPLAIQLALDTKLEDLAVITDAIIGPKETEIVKYCGRDIHVVNGRVLLKGTSTLQ